MKSDYEIAENVQLRVINSGIKNLLSHVETLGEVDQRRFDMKMHAIEAALRQIETGISTLGLRKAEDLGLIKMPSPPKRETRFFTSRA